MAHVAHPTRLSPWPRRPAVLGIVAIAAAAVIAAGSVLAVRATRGSPPPQQHQAAVGAPVASSKPAATPAPTPTPDPRTAAVIQGYRDATAAYVHATSTTNPDDPAIPATMTGNEAFAVLIYIQKDKIFRHIVARGDITPLNPQVVSITGSTATLHSCDFDTMQTYNVVTGAPVNATTGQPLPSGVGINTGVYWTVSATLILDGTWKVSQKDLHVVPSC